MAKPKQIEPKVTIVTITITDKGNNTNFKLETSGTEPPSKLQLLGILTLATNNVFNSFEATTVTES